MVGGPISLVSSITILFMIMRSNKGLSISYHRLLFGLSIADILADIGMSFGPFPSSNQYACSAQGFVFFAGFVAQPLYSCSLQLYYLCSIKYAMKPEDFQKRVEPFLHIIPTLYGLSGSIVSVATKAMNPTGSYCFPASKPFDCDLGIDEDVPCRGESISYIRVIWGLVVVSFTFVFMAIAMKMIYSTVRNKEVMTKSFAFKGKVNPDSKPVSIKARLCLLSCGSCRNQDNVKSGKILKRIMQYYFAFMLANSVVVLGHLLIAMFGFRSDWIYCLGHLFFSLQGFYNLLVFINPRYETVKSNDADLSIIRSFYTAICSYGGVAVVKKKSFKAPTGEIFNDSESVGEESCYEEDG